MTNTQNAELAFLRSFIVVEYDGQFDLGRWASDSLFEVCESFETAELANAALERIQSDIKILERIWAQNCNCYNPEPE
jgi:hypothetical protein